MIGVAIGLASAAAPVYISEVAPPESRGRLVSFFQLAVTIGILVAYLVGLAFDDTEGWRWMLGLGCVPALALGFGMLRMPQSPRWLVMTGDDFAARATLAKIRVDDPDTIDRELEEIKDSLDEKPGAWSELLQPVVKAALVVGVGLAILQQVTGINTVIYYAPTIVEFTGVNSSAGSILAAVGVGVINVGVRRVLALRLLDRAGRRTLLMVGVSGMVISLFALGAAFIGGGGTHPRLGRRDRQPDDLRRLLRDQPRADLLAAERRDLPAQRAQQGRRDRARWRTGPSTSSSR